MLNELTELQESGEDVWGTTELSFTIQTRDSDEDEIVERTYRFSHAKEWDKWTLAEFKERRTRDTERMTARNWRVTARALWNEPDQIPADISVPPEVQNELEERLGVDEIVFQQP